MSFLLACHYPHSKQNTGSYQNYLQLFFAFGLSRIRTTGRALKCPYSYSTRVMMRGEGGVPPLFLTWVVLPKSTRQTQFGNEWCELAVGTCRFGDNVLRDGWALVRNQTPQPCDCRGQKRQEREQPPQASFAGTASASAGFISGENCATGFV